MADTGFASNRSKIKSMDPFERENLPPCLKQGIFQVPVMVRFAVLLTTF